MRRDMRRSLAFLSRLQASRSLHKRKAAISGYSWRYQHSSANTPIKTITTDDLRPGDVVLFSPFPGSTTAQAQVILTSAPVSHSALIWRDPEYLVESIHWDANFSQVSTSKVDERFADREITVKRLLRPPRDNDDGSELEKVLEAADGYVGEPYSRPSEFLQGLFQLYVKLAGYGTREEVERRRGRIRFVRRRTARLMDEMNRTYYPGRRPVLCAEFVYRCFREAGLDLCLANPSERRTFPNAPCQPFPDGAQGSPLDLLLMEIEDCMAEPEFLIPGQTSNERVAELLRMFGGDEIQVDIPDIKEVGTEIVSAICKLVEDPNGQELSLGITETLGEHDVGIDDDADEAQFVTPADLYNNCLNLSYVGTIPFAC